jgi:hypothetical protein
MRYRWTLGMLLVSASIPDIIRDSMRERHLGANADWNTTSWTSMI